MGLRNEGSSDVDIRDYNGVWGGNDGDRQLETKSDGPAC